ncbi:MAG: DNA-3-methyladenine glycosylase family protein [Desulfitobacteriaceae bacterium]
MIKSVQSDLLQAEVAWQQLLADPHLGPTVLVFGKCPLQPQGEYFRELCESILAQQISGKVAATLAERLNIKLQGDYIPEKLLKLGVADLRTLGISVRKAQSILDLAGHCLDGRIPLASLGEMRDDEISQCLIKVKGIGEWTVMMFLIFSLNRPRVIPASDYGIRKAIQKLFELKEIPDTRAVPQYFANWIPHETVASWYLWRSLENQGRA